MAQHAEEKYAAAGPATLGEVLYADNSKSPVPEADWVRLVHSIAAGDQLALHALYERTHRIVFTLTMRIAGSRETAEELTLDVFHDVWRRAADYDPENGTVLGWIMNQARSRALDRLRFEHRRKRVDPHGDGAALAEEPAQTQDLLQLKQQRELLLHALKDLSPGEREAIETAFFSGLTYAEVAVRLNLPLGTVKTRIRCALQKLREALAEGGTRR